MKNQGGLTLLELVIVLAMLAILASLALPSMGAQLDRQRLVGAAEALAADINEARFEAARQGRNLHVQVSSGPAWCWSVATQSDCPCGQAQACELRKANGADHPGLVTLQGAALQLTPRGTIEQPGALRLVSARGLRLRVQVNALGRAHICTEQGPLPRYAAC
jgi:type IV fimbrial biogenesis protein FimT